MALVTNVYWQRKRSGKEIMSTESLRSILDRELAKANAREIIEKEASNLPWGRLGLSEEIAQAACFLVSEQADYITGSILTVDGGFRYKDLRTNVQNKH